MRHTLLIALAAVGTISASALATPPATEPREVVDVMHGQDVPDPYQWLEGDNSDPQNMGILTEEVTTWTDAQNDYTRSVLDNMQPMRGRLEDRLRELMEVPSIGTPRARGSRYFMSRREGAQAQAVHYVREGLEGPERVLLDPVEIDPSGLTTISWTAPNKDGSLMAFGMYTAGDENSTLYVMEVESGTWLAEEIPGKVNFGGWDADSEGFFYSCLADLDNAYSGQFKHHKLGTHHKQDRLLFSQQDIEFFYGDQGYDTDKLEALKTTWGPFGSASEDGRWLMVGYWTGTSGVDLWMADLDQWSRTGELDLKPMVIGQSGRPGSSHYDGDTLYLETTLGASNGRVVAIDLHQPEIQHWVDILPENEDLVLSGVSFARGMLAANYMENASTRIRLYDYDGNSKGDLELPGIGSAGLAAFDDRTEAFLTFSSYNMPRSIYRVDLATNERELWARPDVPVNPDILDVKQVWYDSKDGTKVPMFLVHKKGLELDGNNPTILYGYGGFDISMTPGFSSTLFPWYEAGGVYAVANLRGGGEFGKAWHEAGMLENKQNVFDDFIAAGEWLVANGYTKPERLGIWGGSNGGLLTGAAVTQRPDLFAAAISAVPLLDMLRYQDFLMARYWVPEYGSAENADQFEFIKAYSPYHNIQPGTKYPAVLFTAGENDSRVHPMHARKMAARMQAATASDQNEDPILLWVDRDSGHGQGKPLNLRIRDRADTLIFFMWQTGMLSE